MSDGPEVREEGFYWVALGQSRAVSDGSPATPSQPEAVEVLA